MKPTKITENISFRLSIMKFIAIVAVVYIHARVVDVYAHIAINSNNLPIVYYVQTVWSDYLCRFAVPLFFCLSGFIYFAKQYNHSLKEFAAKKAKEIIFPYVLWNTIAITYIFAAQTCSFATKFFTESSFIADYNFAKWISAYLGFSADWAPFLYPLWFMPYLFISFMVIHIFRKVINLHATATWIVLAAVNVICHTVIPLNNILNNFGPVLRLISSLSFFTFSIFCLKNIILFDNKKVLLFSGLIFASAALIDTLNIFRFIKISPAALYAGIIFIFSLSSQIAKCKSKTQEYLSYVASFSFLIYVTHEFSLFALLKIIGLYIQYKTIPLLIVYIVLPLILISVIVSCGALFRKLSPNFYKFLFR